MRLLQEQPIFCSVSLVFRQMYILLFLLICGKDELGCLWVQNFQGHYTQITLFYLTKTLLQTGTSE